MPQLIITLFTSSQEAKAAGRRTGGAGEGKLKERCLAAVSAEMLLVGCCGMLWG